MRTRPLTYALCLACLVIVAGCTTTSEGSPRPSSTAENPESTPPSTTDEGELPFAGAPAVDTPLDTDRYQQDPCQALTAEQTQELQVNGPGSPHEGSLGNACEFRGMSDRRALIDIRFLNEYPFGLSATYQANEDGKWAHFEELAPIEGYPAVSYDAVDQRDDGECAVMVGTSDEVAFEIALHLSQANLGQKDPCETAAMVAGMALRTMRAGS